MIKFISNSFFMRMVLFIIILCHSSVGYAATKPNKIREYKDATVFYEGYEVVDNKLFIKLLVQNNYYSMKKGIPEDVILHSLEGEIRLKDSNGKDKIYRQVWPVNERVMPKVNIKLHVDNVDKAAIRQIGKGVEIKKVDFYEDGAVFSNSKLKERNKSKEKRLLSKTSIGDKVWTHCAVKRCEWQEEKKRYHLVIDISNDHNEDAVIDGADVEVKVKDRGGIIKCVPDAPALVRRFAQHVEVDMYSSGIADSGLIIPRKVNRLHRAFIPPVRKERNVENIEEVATEDVVENNYVEYEITPDSFGYDEYEYSVEDIAKDDDFIVVSSKKKEESMEITF